MQAPPLPRFLIPRLPFFYGWVVLGCICLAGFARQGPAVAVLSIFVVPMTEAFGWSRTEMSGAVSLGGVLAAIISPVHRPVRRPPRRAPGALPRRGRHGHRLHGAVAHPVAAGLLPPVLLRPHDLGGAVRPRPLRRAQQLVRGAPRHRDVDRDAGADVGAGRAAADRAVRHAAAADWRAGWIAVGATVL